jgi:hypothetical protein
MSIAPYRNPMPQSLQRRIRKNRKEFYKKKQKNHLK